MKIIPLHLTYSTEKIKKLIAEHPDYPVVILAGEDANTGDFSTTYCSNIRIGIKEILEAEAPYNRGIVECDRANFTEQMEEWLWGELRKNDTGREEMPEAEFQRKLRAALAEYEPYWKKVIAIYADN